MVFVLKTAMSMFLELANSFPKGGLSQVPYYCVTPDLTGCIHRFFDSSPISPSGRFIALTQLGSEKQFPQPGDTANIILVDLTTGEYRLIAKTAGWEPQMGAHAQWGKDDTELYFNDVDLDSWVPHAVCVDPFTGKKRKLQGTVYMVSPDGGEFASPCLRRTIRTQAGYGVILPENFIPSSDGIAKDDGITVTNTKTGISKLLVSHAEILAKAQPKITIGKNGDGVFYGFHVKYNPQGTRLMYVLRWVPNEAGGKMLNNVITMNTDGTNICVAVSDKIWRKGGHHPNWCPDGQRILMNIKTTGKSLLLGLSFGFGPGVLSAENTEEPANQHNRVTLPMMPMVLMYITFSICAKKNAAPPPVQHHRHKG